MVSLHREPPEVGLIEKLTVIGGGAVRANPTQRVLPHSLITENPFTSK